MSIDNFITEQKCYSWGNNLSDGSAIKGGKFYYCEEPIESSDTAKLENFKFELKEVKDLTDNTGLSIFKILNYNYNFIILEKNDDISFIDRVGVNSTLSAIKRIFVFDDRKLYKPNETVTIKGFVRIIERTGENNCFQVLKIDNLKNTEVSYKILDSVNAEYLKGTVKINEYGSFKFEFVVPDNVNLGDHKINFLNDFYSEEFSHHFKIQGIYFKKFYLIFIILEFRLIFF
jgi:hypothetical protein